MSVIHGPRKLEFSDAVVLAESGASAVVVDHRPHLGQGKAEDRQYTIRKLTTGVKAAWFKRSELVFISRHDAVAIAIAQRKVQR